MEPKKQKTTNGTPKKETPKEETMEPKIQKTTNKIPEGKSEFPFGGGVLRELETAEEIQKEKERIKNQSNDEEFEEIVIDTNPTLLNS